MRITTIAWTLLAATLAVSAATPATAADGVAFEVVITKPKPGVSLAALLQADKTMEQQFVSKQPGYINREVAVAQDGSVLALVRWQTLAAADAAAGAFMHDPSALARMGMSDASLFAHYIKQ